MIDMNVVPGKDKSPNHRCTLKTGVIVNEIIIIQLTQGRDPVVPRQRLSTEDTRQVIPNTDAQSGFMNSMFSLATGLNISIQLPTRILRFIMSYKKMTFSSIVWRSRKFFKAMKKKESFTFEWFISTFISLSLLIIWFLILNLLFYM